MSLAGSCVRLRHIPTIWSLLTFKRAICVRRSVTLWVAARDMIGNINPQLQQQVLVLPDVTPPAFLSASMSLVC